MERTYLDTGLSASERTDLLMTQMTMEEKAGQLIQFDARSDARKWIKTYCAGSALHVQGDQAKRLQRIALTETRLGIPLLLCIDAIHGHCFNPASTVFPTQLALASSFNPALAKAIAKCTAKAVLADGLHLTFSPVLCLGRDLRWGRVDETFGEDHYLAGRMGTAMVEGYQGEDLAAEDSIAACAKHYIAYGETVGGRDSAEADCSESTIRNILLPPFRRVIDAGCASVMAAYHAVNGLPCSANSWLLRDILRNELDFDGIVITDWNNLGWFKELQKIAANDREAVSIALDSGNDLIMNSPFAVKEIIDGIHDGSIDPSLVDSCCRRILRLKFLLGLFDGKAIPEITLSEQDKHTEAELAVEAAASSCVLLKNSAGTLPLQDPSQKILVTGPLADNVFDLLGDWSFGPRAPGEVDWNGSHADTVTPYRGIRSYLSDDTRLLHCLGCSLEGENADKEHIQNACERAKDADAVVVVIGDGFNQNGEGRDRADLTLSGNQEELLRRLRPHTSRLIVVLVLGKPLAIPIVDELADSILLIWNPGSQGGTALAEILFGKRNPEGKLPISFPYATGQLPVYYNQPPGWHGGKYWDIPAEPLYAFGYGLSYTTFKLSEIRLQHNNLTRTESLSLSFRLQNTGDREGVEIVQYYLSRPVGLKTRPEKQLVHFERVSLQPGETANITSILSIGELIQSAPALMTPAEGNYMIQLGTSCRDCDLTSIPFCVV